MMFRKIPVTLLTLALGITSAYAKKTPVYSQVHPLTPEQAALVQKAIGQEKILIKAIQQRTPLVETYIQNTRPDVKLYQVPVGDQYTLSRVDFGKGFFDKTYEPRDANDKKGWFKGSMAAITGLTKALSLDGRAFDIACGQIDIGNAATDMTLRMRQGILQANGQVAVEPTMDVADVARAVVYMASLPLSANVQTLTVMARDMPYVGRG